MKITVIGGGAWGTALACAARRAGSDVVLWARNKTVVDDINGGKGNPTYLADIRIEAAIQATSNMEYALDEGEVILLVVPAQHMREIAEKMASYIADEVVVICCKGVERESLMLMHQIASDILPKAQVAILSGPTFAKEVAIGLPTAVTIAAEEEVAANKIVQAIGAPTFRPYITTDRIGAEIGGAVKNVLAIACGIIEGRQLGENARAALMTRGLAEVIRLGVALGAQAETLTGLCGLGDLTLTCSSMQSRNMSFGVALGQGQTVAEILSSRITVTEGVWSAASVVALAQKHGVKMPICQAVDAIVNHQAEIGETIRDLLNRPIG